MKKIGVAILCCVLGSAAYAQSIVGTWSMQVRTNTPDPGSAAGVVILGVIYTSFYPNGTFRKVTQLQNGRVEAVGHYRFDGQTLYYVVDDYNPKFISEPAYHRPSTAPVQVLSGAELLVNGEIMHRQHNVSWKEGQGNLGPTYVRSVLVETAKSSALAGHGSLAG